MKIREITDEMRAASEIMEWLSGTGTAGFAEVYEGWMGGPYEAMEEANAVGWEAEYIWSKYWYCEALGECLQDMVQDEYHPIVTLPWSVIAGRLRWDVEEG